VVEAGKKKRKDILLPRRGKGASNLLSPIGRINKKKRKKKKGGCSSTLSSTAGKRRREKKIKIRSLLIFFRQEGGRGRPPGEKEGSPIVHT